MKKSLYIIVLAIFIFSQYSCKKDNSKKPKKTPEKSIKKIDYKVCLDKKTYDGIRLGNYSYILKITPNLSKPKNDMEYRLLLIRKKKMHNRGNLKLNDSVIDILINKNTIKDLDKKNSINIQNFHLLETNYHYARASEMHFGVSMYSVKDSLSCNISYHFNYLNGKYRYYISVIKEKKIEAFEQYENFSCSIFQYD